ncbi:DIL and Ankyrin domain protein [Talaromyces stipitatus ATCC 10500]|uniref:DIL and Ankyrin domain protein n=1 Tax=Talaromyces stipitatus (strain ATCC 10500 / CBS 375.48 / QM 6759 / NRRL 1006) TaxID=441959 RepID=B8M649_TALSN|nr:DIL and Ankyrin domain protein [Talaromyces stipitatus ATCC 10500]EED19049.1 DIL and Ankyrin domain protein [Talaromyces stipitatus ATCC 10500]
MDIGDPHPGTDFESDIEINSTDGTPKNPRTLPPDLPTSLDDRRQAPEYAGETEMYDGWQGQSQFLTTPITAKPLSFSLALDDHSHDEEHELRARYAQSYYDREDDDITSRLEDSDARLLEMLAAQAAHREMDSLSTDDDDIALDDNLSEEEKKSILQKSLNMAASNGDVERVRKLVNGRAHKYVDVNKPDEEGTVPLIYASCFGHQDVVSALLDVGAFVDKQDRNQWSALMWAMTNRHKTIAKVLLDHGASPDIKSSSGGTALDFLQPGTDISQYLHDNGYNIGPVGIEDDFYDSGFSHGRFEEEMAQNEMRRRMMMEESALNLEVDLSSLGLDEKIEEPDDFEDDQQEFVWDRCLNDQMFVFQDNELEKILDIIITNMTPQRSPSQKPVPANLLFLSARYAHYHASPELLAQLLMSATDKINDVVERHQWDMTILAFWISNATLLLHYLKKDPGLMVSTVEFQLHLAELINEIFILIIRDAERRMNRVLDQAMLDHETIPGLSDVTFQNEWKIFKSKPKPKVEPPEKRFRPPSPKRRAQVSPRNITSLLSSTLFVLDLYDVHSLITSQIISQLLYWLGAELFNRIMLTKKYLARTKAMQIRMNISALEEWARNNNRKPEHYENGSMTTTGDTTVESARKHLAPVIQLLQWLQCFSSLGDDHEALITTLLQLQQLTPNQLLQAARSYRAEVGEKGLSKNATRFLVNLQHDPDLLYREHVKLQKLAIAASNQTAPSVDNDNKSTPLAPSSPTKPDQSHQDTPQTPTTATPADQDTNNHTDHNNGPSTPRSSVFLSSPIMSSPSYHFSSSGPDSYLLDPSMTLPFILPTSTDMLISYGAGFGGTNKERARKYIPTVPTEVLSRFDRV